MTLAFLDVVADTIFALQYSSQPYLAFGQTPYLLVRVAACCCGQLSSSPFP